MIKEKIGIFALLVVINIHLSAQTGIRFTDGSLSAIMSIAKERNKNVFIDTYADWCAPCKRMEKKFKNRDVADFFNEHFINYRVNMQNPTRAADLRRKYDVVFLPTMYILDPNGLIKYQVDRELTVSELLNAAQASLDPGSYFVSEATAVRRKDGTITGGQRKIENNTKDNKGVPKSIAVAQAQKEEIQNVKPKKSIDTATGNISISEATRRAKILESYETVDGSSQKVLAVLGEGELPPEVLRQEAYLRLEFMDGSSDIAAKKYLATQSDWSTVENRKFIFDFVGSTFSDEYDYLCKHKQDFIDQFGQDKVKRTLEVLTYRTLHNAVPRPSMEEAIALYANLDESSSIKKATHYYVTRLVSEDNTEEALSISESYLKSADRDHEMMYKVARAISVKSMKKDTELDRATSLMKEATKINAKSIIYFELLASLFEEKGNAKEAKNTYSKAIDLAKELGVDYQNIEARWSSIEG